MRPSRSAVALLAVALLAASGFAALRHADVVLRPAFMATCAILALATVGAACRPSGKRSGWAGFALFGWGYFALVFSSWTPDSLWHGLPTTQALEALQRRLAAPPGPSRPPGRAMGFTGLGMSRLPATPGSEAPTAPDVIMDLATPLCGVGFMMIQIDHSYHDGLCYGHCLWALLVACVGGVAGHLLCGNPGGTIMSDREAPSSPPAGGRTGRRGLSVSRLMGVVTVAALGLAALRNASAMLAGVVFLVTCGLLGLAVLGALGRPAGRRVGWLGFAMFGWGYMLLAFTAFLGFQTFDGWTWRRPELVTVELLEALFDRFPALHGAGSRDSDSSRRTLAVRAALEKPVPIPFKDETPLQAVVAYLTSATVGPDLPKGIPIYVDPNGLQEQDKTMESTIVLRLEGVPLRTTLGLMLRQLDLDYRVKDGLLYILSKRDDSFEAREFGPFQRIGHCLFALLSGILGGLAGPRVAGRRPGGDS